MYKNIYNKFDYAFIFIAISKILTAICSFILIHFSLKLLGSEKYGIWITITSVIQWMYILDLGIGNGMRNELSKSFVLNDLAAAKSIISTAYIALGAPIFLFTSISLIFVDNIQWASALNVSENLENEIRYSICIIIIFFAIRLFLNLITSILLADQKPVISEFISLFISILTLLCVVISGVFIHYDLIVMSYYSMVAPVIFLFLLSIYFYNKKYYAIRPNFKCFSTAQLPNIFNIGLKFLYIQAGGILFFSAAIFFIGSWGGQENVAVFNVVYKYFSIILIFASAYAIPMWSLSSGEEALGKKDIYRTLIKNGIRLFGSVLTFFVLLALVSKYIFKIWVPELGSISWNLIFLVGVLIVLQAMSYPFSSVINGSGKVSIPIISVTVRSVAIYPLCLLLYKYWSVEGIIIGLLVLQVFALILEIAQVKELAKPDRKNSLWTT